MTMPSGDVGVEPAYIQVLSLGLIWVFLHCAPMCGPIVGGLNLPATVGGSVWKSLLLYQAGRGMMYILFGAVAGYFSSEFLTDTPIIGFALAAFLFVMAIQKLIPKFSPKIPDGLIRTWAKLAQKLDGPLRPFFLGVLLSFLPCMLTFWAIALAAGSGSIWSGALTMFLLIVITSLPLFAVVAGGKALRFPFRARLDGILLLISGAWVMMMTAGALGWIDHLHFNLELFGKNYHFMFW